MNRNDQRLRAGAEGHPHSVTRRCELEGHGLTQPILRADVAGMPLEWVDYKEAARLYTQARWPMRRARRVRLRGGYSAVNGRRTVLELNSIIATIGHTANPGNTRHDYVPPL